LQCRFRGRSLPVAAHGFTISVFSRYLQKLLFQSRVNQGKLAEIQEKRVRFRAWRCPVRSQQRILSQHSVLCQQAVVVGLNTGCRIEAPWNEERGLLDGAWRRQELGSRLGEESGNRLAGPEVVHIAEVVL